VGELPLEAQPRLLRALERKEVKRVGGDGYRSVDVRVISATHRDLERSCAEGRFREDLFHRLVVTRVSLPPLRERLEDIPLLVDQLLAQLSKVPAQLDPQTRAMLADYAWPGNIRELRNVVARAVALGGEAALPPSVRDSLRPASREDASALPFKEAKEQMVESFERDYLAQLIARCDWNISQASREAGIARFYLRQLLTKHELKKP
jgi:two-component system, NtrC family, nitrogen regulation response regulator GlnG